MSLEATTVVVALAGGVGGALLTGVFNAVIQTFADRRRSRHELDTWLRERRFTLIGELPNEINQASAQVNELERRLSAGNVHDNCVRVMMVVPDSLASVLQDSVRLIRDELEGNFSVRSVKAIAWQSAYLQRALTAQLGWNAEPVGVRRTHRKIGRQSTAAE